MRSKWWEEWDMLPKEHILNIDIVKFHPDFNLTRALLFIFEIKIALVPAARTRLLPK